MEKQERRQKLLENLIYLIIWVVILVSPLLEHKYNGETINWNDIFRAWKMIAPFFILFLINNYVLIPFFTDKEKVMALPAILLADCLPNICLESFRQTQTTRRNGETSATRIYDEPAAERGKCRDLNSRWRKNRPGKLCAHRCGRCRG